MTVEVHGDLSSGLVISALMPRHLAGNCHPVSQSIILTLEDSRELAQKLTEMHILHNHPLLKTD